MSNLPDFSHGAIRVTEDFKYSVYDVIAILGGKKNAHESWKNFCLHYPNFLQKIEKYKFPGRGQHFTPVATSGDLQTVLALLPDAVQKKVLGIKQIRQCEEYYRRRLFSKLGGKTEISTPVGRIDLLTKSQIIEVKRIEEWKSALGQIEVYGDYYPSHEKRIHLYGPCLQSQLDLIKSHCARRCVVVTWQAH